MSKVIIKDITSKVGSGATPTGGSNAYRNSGIAFIRSQNILDFVFSTDGLVFIDEKQAKALDVVTVQKGDVLFNITGDSIARCCIVPEEILPARVNQHVSIIRTNKIDSRYLLYYLQYLKPYLLKICGVGGTRNALTKEAIQNLPFTHNKNEELIANMLSNLDRKIQLNNKINETLQQQASLLYDYWFTQFDFPDENGKPYKFNGGKMVWNEELKREIPDGWMNATFSNLIKETKNGDWGKGTCEGNYTHKVRCIRGADFPSTNSGLLNAPYRFILARNSDKELTNGDIIIEISGGSPTQSTGRVVYINETTLKRFRTNIITSNFCKAVSLKKNNFQYWFYLYWKKLYENHVLFGYEGKTTGIKNFLFEDFITSYKIVCPSEEIITNFNNTISSTFNKIQLNNIENDKLASLRDWLLPMLMNGQATIAEEQKSVFRVIENDTKNEQPDRFAMWLQNQGLAARGDIDKATLREIFDAMDDDDK